MGRSDYNFLTNQCRGNPEQSGYLDRLHKGSQATLTAEDVGVTRDGNKVCVGNEGETFRALMVIPVPRNGVPLVGTFAIKNQGDKSFNNDDFDLLCCDDENVAAVTKEHRSDKQPVCVQFSASASKSFGPRGALQAPRISCTPDNKCSTI